MTTLLPARLFAASYAVLPPANPRLAALPFDQLPWQAFERLCVRLAQRESRIEDFVDYGTAVRPYGVQGNKQAGIDLFTRLPTPSDGPTRYRTYQCKRVKKFTATHIKAAVALFRKEKWFKRSQEFVLCTSESLSDVKQTDEVERQNDLLQKDGIIFTVWDSEALNTKLKNEAELVDEFFGREWVRLFCGEEAAQQLSRKRPLSPEKVLELRLSLGDFYWRLFSLHDPSLPGGSAHFPLSLPLQQRFVVPHIETQTEIVPGSDKPSNPQTQPPLHERRDRFQNQRFFDGEDASSRFTDWVPSEIKTRFPLESWLLGTSRGVILGDAGSGKSTLSRFLTLDLLAPEPQFFQISAAWNHAIPVWLPFGLWTRRVSDDPTQPEISLASFLKDWFLGQDEARLWPLVEEALEDERLVLVVDGLDEWSDESAARNALRHLQLFVDRRQIPTVVTGRPYGFSRLSMPTEGWQIGHLTSFDAAQQEQLVQTWLAHFLGLHGEDNADPTAPEAQVGNLTRNFMAQIADSPDLRELAGNPLLLCLLLGLSLHRKHLPSDRFHAYSEAVRYLIEDHPRRRADAMGTAPFTGGGAQLSEDDWRSIYAFLAFRLQTRQSQGTVETGEARRWVEEFLRDEDRLGLDAKTAREIARALLEISDEATGLLVRKSPRDVGFYHRSFQEYLAAEHLNSLAPNVRLALVEKHAANPQWQDVILALCSRQYQADGFRDIVQTLERVENQSLIQGYRLAPLLAEIAFGRFSCPANLGRSIAHRIFARIEADPHTPSHTLLLRHALNGLRSPSLRELVGEKISRYFPARRGVWEGLYRVFGEWPRSPAVEAVLLDTLRHEDESHRLAAARGLSKFAEGNAELGEKVASLAQTDWRTPVRAAALGCLRLGWPQHPNLAALAEAGSQSADSRLRCEAVLARMTLRQHTDADRRTLWDIVTTRDHTFWRDIEGREMGAVLLRGWPDSAELKRESLLLARRLLRGKSLNKSQKSSIFNAGDATARVVVEVLVTGFPGDEEVAQCFADHLEAEWQDQIEKGDHHRVTLFHDWHGHHMELLRKQSSQHPKVREAVEAWLARDWKHKPGGWQQGALICPTPERKQKILESAQKFSSPLWGNQSALLALEGWGLEDAETNAVLNELAWGDALKASAVGAILPRLIPDRAQCRARILEILRSPDCENFAALLEGLSKIEVAPDDAELVDALFSKTGPFARYGTRYFVDSYDDPGPDRDKWPSAREIARLLQPESAQIDPHAVNWEAFTDNYRSQGILAHIFVLFPAEPRVRDLVLLWLERPEGELAAIARGFKDDEFVRTQLLALANPLPVALRRVIANRVREGSGDDHFDWKMARLASFDHDGHVRVLGSYSYHRLLKNGWGNSALVPKDCVLPDREKVVQKLREGLEAWGASVFRRHEADFAGLLALERLDVARQAQPEGLKFQFISQNQPLVELMVENWGQIERELGENPFRSSTYDRGDSDFWEAATPIAAPFPPAREAAIRFSSPENNKNRVFLREDVLLRLMAQMGDREGILEAFSRLHHPSDAAATILGRFFGGDTAILERVGGDWKPLKERWRELKAAGILPDGAAAFDDSVVARPEVAELDWDVWRAARQMSIEVLCEVWPSSDEAQMFFESVQRRHWEVAWDNWFLIAEHIATPERLAQRFQSYLQKAPTLEDYNRNARPILRSLERRLKRDEDLQSRLMQILSGTPTSHEKINLVRLLLQSPTGQQETSRWVEAEIARQQALHSHPAQPVEEGFDSAENRTKSVFLALVGLIV